MSRALGQKSLSARGKQNSVAPKGNNISSQLAPDGVVLLKTAANLWASRGKANELFAVFSSFELGCIYNKTLNDLTCGGVDPREIVSFISPRPQCYPRLRLVKY